jgi:protein-tyrosine-phosphatase
MIFFEMLKSPANRRMVLALGLLVATGPTVSNAKSARGEPQRVLFVCQFGTVKSALARELFRRRAADRGIKVAVMSRGITPEPHLSAAVGNQLRAERIDLDRDPLKRLTRADMKASDIIVIFNPLPASMRTARMRDWSDTPSVNEAYPSARVEFDRRIDLLLDEIAKPRR